VKNNPHGKETFLFGKISFGGEKEKDTLREKET